jgi:hypothetical protein
MRDGKSKWKVPMFLVSKQNLNSSYWCLWGIKNCQKWDRMENVMAPQSIRGQNLKKKTIECYKG